MVLMPEPAGTTSRTLLCRDRIVSVTGNAKGSSVALSDDSGGELLVYANDQISLETVLLAMREQELRDAARRRFQAEGDGINV